MDSITLWTVALLVILFVALVQATRRYRHFKSFLPSLNHIVQIIFLVVAVYGYVFTVKPIYENKKLQQNIDDKKKIITSIEKRANDLRSQIARAKNEKDKVTAELKKTRAEQNKVEIELSESKEDLASARADIERVYTKIYVTNIRSASIAYFYRYMDRETEDRLKTSMKDAVRAVPSAYESISAVLDNNDYDPEELPRGNEFYDIVPRSIKLRVIKTVRSELETRKSELAREGIDDRAIKKAYANSTLMIKNGDEITKVKPSDQTFISNVMQVQSDRIVNFFTDIEDNYEREGAAPTSGS